MFLGLTAQRLVNHQLPKWNKWDIKSVATLSVELVILAISVSSIIATCLGRYKIPVGPFNSLSQISPFSRNLSVGLVALDAATIVAGLVMWRVYKNPYIGTPVPVQNIEELPSNALSPMVQAAKLSPPPETTEEMPPFIRMPDLFSIIHKHLTTKDFINFCSVNKKWRAVGMKNLATQFPLYFRDREIPPERDLYPLFLQRKGWFLFTSLKDKRSTWHKKIFTGINIHKGDFRLVGDSVFYLEYNERGIYLRKSHLKTGKSIQSTPLSPSKFFIATEAWVIIGSSFYIHIFDSKDLNLVQTFKCDSPLNNLQLVGNLLYTFNSTFELSCCNLETLTLQFTHLLTPLFPFSQWQKFIIKGEQILCLTEHELYLVNMDNWSSAILRTFSYNMDMKLIGDQLFIWNRRGPTSLYTLSFDTYLFSHPTLLTQVSNLTNLEKLGDLLFLSSPKELKIWDLTTATCLWTIETCKKNPFQIHEGEIFLKGMTDSLMKLISERPIDTDH